MTANRSRRFDGKPESAADSRFFDLRESGYTGPIDQDGRPVTSGRAVEILTALREATPKGGWDS
ncbi:hypothetical protein LCL61_17520 [Amycolatopsis coloradensis]|uniref:Uncharacterized protein n=1 Tax=Amycolatopsis coloradensis TaxID=76021 RepID=A0ACD5BDB9_9PSEU